ncbi:MAG: mannonate dehydratase [Clostridiaceae bacterium]|jgi:mannonate dehydratase|nr:mannonate dehydratase [Clostridiaceae bacterium]
MKMIFRWFPNGDDSVQLHHIKQIPGVTGVATALPHIPVGDVWPTGQILAVRDQITSAGLEMEVIESVNIHEDIKKGLPSRDLYISNYITTMKNLHEVGIRCICYNFMPVMDWIRSDLAEPLPDGSTAMSYRHDKILMLDPHTMAHSMINGSNQFSLPGWEPERFSAMAEDIEFYRNVSVDEYFENIAYFIRSVMPFADEYEIDFAVHSDDPPWPIFGLPKIINNASSIRRFLSLHPSKHNGIAFCTGSLGADSANDLPNMIREFASAGRIPFAHLRNVKHTSPTDFHETAHLSGCGDLDMFEIVKALIDSGFDGYIRPDHGRMIWDETGRPGYGLYDRALGSNYLQGLWEAVKKMS